jgi:hypothetical protein
VLRRELYRGTIVYNKTRKRDDDGSRHRGRQPKKPESEWVTIDAPQLRIIDEALAETVDAKRDGTRNRYLRSTKGRLLGRPVEGKYLLAGFLACECGARFEAVKNWRGTHAYVCSARRRKGPDVCPSEVVMPVHEIESTFLDVIEGTVLHPDFIDQLVDEVFADNPDAERVALVEDRKRLACEIENLTKAIAAGGDIPALAAALSERDKRLKAMDARLAKPTIAPPDREVLRAALQLREGQWRDVLRSRHIPQARLVLQHLIDLPIKILNQAVPSYITKGDTRGTENIKWTAQTRPGGMLVGLVQNVASHGTPSWNQILTSLRALDLLRKTVEAAA